MIRIGPNTPNCTMRYSSKLQRMNVRILPADIGSGVPDGGEAMLGVPDHVRREQGERDRARPRRRGRLSAPARASRETSA